MRTTIVLSVWLYTPAGEEEAALAERGVPTGEEPLFWSTTVVGDEADEDATWIRIDVPESVLAVHESRVDPALGYREFMLPPSLVARYPATRLRG